MQPLPAPSPRGRWLGAAALLVAGLLAYHNSCDGPFVFDDTLAVPENATIRALWPLSVPLSPPVDSGVGGRPLANLSFALNHALDGTSVWGYHAGNLLLHLGSGLLLFGIVGRSVARGGRWLGFSAAWLWLVHPLTTAAVSYVSQRTEVLMAFFYLLTLYAFLRGWRAVSVTACALGMLSKEVMVTAPVLVLLYDRTFVAGSLAAAWRARGRYYSALGATWLVLAWVLAQGLERRSVGFGLGVSPLDYALNACGAVWLYLRLAVWPAPLVFDYGRAYGVEPLAVAGVVAVVALTVWWLRRRPALGFCAAALLLLLAPTTSFVPVADQPVAENRMYLPLALLAAGAAVAAARLGGRASRVAVVGAAAGLTALTIARNEVYGSEITLWQDTAFKRPTNPRAHYNQAVVLLNAGRAAEAVAPLERALALQREYAEARNALGNARLQLGQVGAALPEYAEAVRLLPQRAKAWYDYGTALLEAGDAAGARERLERAVALQPGFAPAHNNLGNAYLASGDAAGAARHFLSALALDPLLVDAHYNAGSVALTLGDVTAAVKHFAAAVRLRPEDAELRNNHGAALVRAGQIPAAIAELEQALRLRPGYAEARENLALAQAMARGKK